MSKMTGWLADLAICAAILATLYLLILWLTIVTIEAFNNYMPESSKDCNEEFVACLWCSEYDDKTNSCVTDTEWAKWCEAWFPEK